MFYLILFISLIIPCSAESAMLTNTLVDEETEWNTNVLVKGALSNLPPIVDVIISQDGIKGEKTESCIKINFQISYMGMDDRKISIYGAQYNRIGKITNCYHSASGRRSPCSL